VYGAHHRIFTDTGEYAIADHIAANWPLPGRLFTDATFVTIATAVLIEKSKDPEPPLTSSAPPVFLVLNREISFLLAESI
jgi:hypothetical protein